MPVSTSLFTIQCETCTARLKVRDASTVGQILACPKCESMVQVVPPPGWEPPEDATLDRPSTEPSDKPKQRSPEQAASPRTASRNERVPEQRVPEQRVPEQRVPEQRAKGASPRVPIRNNHASSPEPSGKQRPTPRSSKQPVAREKIAREKTATAAALRVTPPPIESASTLAEGVGSVSPTVPVDQPAGSGWVSPTEKLVRQWLLVAGGLVAGAIMTVGVWAFFRSGDHPPEPTADAIAGTETPRDHDDKDDKDDKDDSPTPVADETAPSQVSVTPTLPDKIPETDQAREEPTSDSTVAVKPTDAEENNNPDMAVEDDATPEEDPVAENDPGVDIPDGIIPDFDAPEFDAPRLGTTGPNLEKEIVKKPRRKPLEVIDVESRLQDPIGAFEFRKIALWRYLDFLSQMSTIPMTLDHDALQQQKVAADVPVSIKLQETTIEAALDGVLGRLKLKFENDHGQLLITAPRDNTSTLHQQSLVVSDLTKEDAGSLDQLAKLIPRLVAPTSWQSGRGRGRIHIRDGQLVVNQTPRVTRQVQIFLNRLRTARGLFQPDATDADRPKLISRYAQIRGSLEQKVAVSFTVPTPLFEILDRLRAQTELVVLVDWRSLSTVHVGPMTSGRMSARGKSLDAALEGTLGPLDLTFRIVNATTIEITTQERDIARREIEFYALDALATNDEQVQRLIDQVKQDVGRHRFEGPAARLHYDPVSRFLIVSADQRLQIDIEKRLGIERAKMARN